MRSCNSEKRWRVSCVLLAWVAIGAFFAGVCANNIRMSITERDVDWPWKPQLDLRVPERFFTGDGAEMRDVDHWRVLSYVGAPLRITSDNLQDLMQLVELVNFMRADGTGLCPHYSSPYRVFYYRFHPAELELLYGEPRWTALQRLQEPEAWSLVLKETIGPAVRAAESAIAQLKTIDPPGQLILSVKEKNSSVARELRVSLADFRVHERVIAVNNFEYRLPQLSVDGEAAGRRHHLHHFLKVKHKVNAQIAEFDAVTAQIQMSLLSSLVELQQEEQKAYDTHGRFKERYQAFLLERQSRQRAEAADVNADTTGRIASRAATLLSALKVHTAVPQLRTVEERRAVSCRKIHAAWDTLRANGVRWEEDGRAAQLRRLHDRHNCPDEVASLQSVDAYASSVDSADDDNGKSTVVAEPSAAAREVWVMSVAEMLAQREKSGRSPTFAQLFAVLFAVWKTEREEDVKKAVAAGNRTRAGSREGSAGAGGDVAARVVYDPDAFVTFASAFVESGDAVAMAGGVLPRFVRAELHYMVGIMNLVMQARRYQHSPVLESGAAAAAFPSSSDIDGGDDDHRNSGSGGGKADAVAHGVVQLHESLSAGSHHAAGALATLREHGIFVRQHSKAAMQLLLQSMKTAPSYLLRELLLTPRTQAVRSAVPSPSASSGAVNLETQEEPPQERKLGIARLLRFEQFYAVDHTFHDVDDPFMTRAGVTTLVAVSSENARTGDDAPELEDVYQEAKAVRTNSDFETSITIRLNHRVLKANMLFSGFKGMRRDPHEAECELLGVLRQLGYFCDLNVKSLLSAERSGGARAKGIETIIGVPLPDSCPEHDAALFSVLGNRHHTILTCPGDGMDAVAHGHPRLPVPTSEALFAMLHQVLLSLSYVHLLHTQQYELSHMYATLSLEMSLRLQQQLVTRLARVLRLDPSLLNTTNKLLGGDGSNGSGSSSSSSTNDKSNSTASSSSLPATLSPYEALQRLSDSPDDVAWAAETLLDESESDAGDEAGSSKKAQGSSSAWMNERAARAIDGCRSIAESPFVNTETLLLLALSLWAKRGPLVGTMVTAADVEERISRWTLEPFRLLAHLLDPSSSASFSASPHFSQRVKARKHENASRKNTDDNDLQRLQPSLHAETDTRAPPQRGESADPLDAHALFLVCLAAMKRWKRDFPAVHLLDSTSFSVRRTDPFVMASFLLHAQDAATGAPLISIPKLRDMAAAAAPHFLGRTPHFLPLVDDTVETYAARLLRFATRHIHALEPAVELLRSGSYGVGHTMDDTLAPTMTAATTFLRRHGVVDDAPPRGFRLRTLRRAKQQMLETADLQPLLYAADMHDYLNQSRWTFMGLALSMAYNALLYPFTATTSESVLAAMEARLQLIAPEERKEVLQAFVMNEVDAEEEAGTKQAHGGAEERGTAAIGGTKQPSPYWRVMHAAAGEEATSVSPFIDAFARDTTLREHFIACQLLSFTLESGMPEGFSLMFVEAADRGNPWLRRIVDYLADSVFGRWTATVWTEHHLSAQWQREKKDLALDGSIFSLNTRSPFRYASMEGRQELFARLSRWQAATAATAAERLKDKDGATAAAAATAAAVAARDHLLWCAGLLTRKAYYGAGQIYPLSYEGALYPAADLQCLAELNAALAANVSSAGPAKPAWSKAQWRQAQRNGTALLRDLGDRLGYDYDLIATPPARRLPLSERDFRRNTSDVDAAADSAERLHAHHNRFVRASTQFVEPWNRRSREISAESLDYGEGIYYNSRLHRVSGYRWGAMLQSWWLWLRHLLP